MVRVFLTEKGQEKKEIAYETVIAFNQFVHSKINPKDLQVFFKVIQHINRIVDDITINQLTASN